MTWRGNQPPDFTKKQPGAVEEAGERGEEENPCPETCEARVGMAMMDGEPARKVIINTVIIISIRATCPAPWREAKV